MRKTLSIFALALAFCFLFAGKSGAQFGWVWQNPLPTGEGLGSVKFFSTTEGWMSTESGGLLHTTNGGTNWTEVTPDPSVIVTAIIEPNGPASSFINSSTGWIIGIQGGFSNPQGPSLYKTTNSGASWTSQPVGFGVANAIFGLGVYFLNANLGWATVASGSFPDNIAGVLRKSMDGGDSWNTVFTAPPNYGVFSMQFMDADNGWAIMDSVSPTEGDLVSPTMVIRTTDGGSNWDTLVLDPTPGTFSNLQFLDLDTGWVVGDSTKILHTTNGGTNWSAVSNTGIPAGFRCRAVFFVNTSTGWIAADDQLGNKYLVHTTNGGASWTNQDAGLNSSINSIHFIDASNGWVAANGGEIAHTTNGGMTTWSPQSSSVTTGHLNGVTTLPGDIGRAWAVGDFGNVLLTTDGGTNWTFISTGVSNNLYGVSFPTVGTGYAAGDNIVLKTTNEGNNWNGVTPSFPYAFYAVDFFDANLGWVVGQFGSTYRTTDGGANWSLSFPGGPDLHGVHFVDASNGWSVGNGGAIYWTVDSGKTWISQTSGTNQNLNGVYFTDLFNGTAVGDSGTILRTTDGGANWNPQTSGTTGGLYGVAFTDASSGTVVGEERLILQTTNGGSAWVRQFGGGGEEGERNLLRAVSFVEDNTGVAVGENGTILHIGLIGTDVPIVKNNRPTGFELSQNYPNPFNPATTVQFFLPKRQKISLEIYNLLGERIRVLADGEFTAGAHSLVWDGRDGKGKTVSSGVYFYRLKSEDYSETKKMIFVK